MNSTLRGIRDAIAPLPRAIDPGQLELVELDFDRRLGVGRDGLGGYVLVGPGQPRTEPGRGARYEYVPWGAFTDTRSGRDLEGVCVLTLRPHDVVHDDEVIQDVVAVVFAGLLELAISTPTALGPAIKEMEGLFESGLVPSVEREKEVGLAGELLVIAEALDTDRLVTSWHSGPYDLFDFSAHGERLDVKTTTSAERTHIFSDGQVAPIPGVCTTIVSVKLPLVADGSTVASLFEELCDSESLSDDQKAEIRAMVIETTGVAPELLGVIVFDRVAARASLRHFVAGDIPQPIRTEGVGAMSWEATLSEDVPDANPGCRFSSALGFPAAE